MWFGEVCCYGNVCVTISEKNLKLKAWDGRGRGGGGALRKRLWFLLLEDDNANKSVVVVRGRESENPGAYSHRYVSWHDYRSIVHFSIRCLQLKRNKIHVKHIRPSSSTKIIQTAIDRTLVRIKEVDHAHVEVARPHAQKVIIMCVM